MKNKQKQVSPTKPPAPGRRFRFTPIIVAMSAIGFASSALAVDRTWFGGTGDWNTAANWAPNGVPGSSDRAIIGGGSAALTFDTGVAGFNVLGGRLSGAGDLAVSGLTTFTGGQIGGDGGNAVANGGLSIGGAGTKTLGQSSGAGSSGIVNNGTGTWTGTGNINNWDSGRFTNSAGASFDIQTDADFLNGTFINQGTLTKSVGATDGSDKTVISALFNNSGSVNVTQGVLSLTGGGTHTGSFATGSQGWIEFAGSSSKPTHDLNSGASLTGNVRMINSFGALVVNTGATYNASQTEIVNGGSLSVASGVTANTGTLAVSGGDLRGVGDVAVSGATTYTGGQIGGDGGNAVANGGLSIGGAGTKTLGHSGGAGSSGIVNNGAATWTGTGNIDNWDSGRFTNSVGASFDIQTDADFRNGTFINQGVLTKSVGATDGSDKTVISGTLNNTTTGTINVQQGTLEVSSAFNNEGTINVATGAVFYGSNRTFTNAGTLQGDGTFQTALNNVLVNNNEINPGNGIGHLTIDGDLNQGASGTINLQLASLGNFDTLTVSGDVTLGGNLLIANLGYAPVVGDTFVVATFDDRLNNSQFLPIETRGYGADVRFEALYHEHDVTLRVTAVPEPESWAMLVAGLGLMGAVIRRRRVDRTA
jgi:autotransporter-associated beta strand protein